MVYPSQRKALALLSLFALCTSACANSGTTTMLPPVDTSCSSDFSCAEGQVCVEGSCVTGECNVQRSCGAGETCDTTTFTCSGSAVMGCSDTNPCETGFCISGSCQDVQCVVDSDCMSAGMRCDTNRCVTIASCVDADNDGYGTNCSQGPDCDDSNGMVNPGQVENGELRCDDGIDHDCNGVDAVCGEEDADGDGFAEKDGDCDDNDPNVNPAQVEVYYNGVDDDCNMMTNDSDRDGDGFAADEVGGPDCDDMNPNITPIAEDVPGNGIDEDCDGMDRVLSNDDQDDDGVTEQQGDCNDNNPNISPNATEIPYNSVDDDCNVATRDNDLDGDGFGIPRDCNDEDPAINPNATEVYYNGVDEDCDPNTLDADADGDGVNSVEYGGADCNDEVATVNPSATEIPYNGVDDDCNPNTRDDDLDNDGYPRAEDCDEENANINPGVTENASLNCDDGIDHNCVGGDVDCDENVEDDDGDGVPNAQDCEPDNPDIPGPFEIANNGLNDDCDANTLDSCDDDLFDNGTPNGSPAQASAVMTHNLFSNNQYQLALCPGDEDWYQIRVDIGDGIEIDVDFADAEGDIDVRLFRRNGADLIPAALTQVASSTSGTDDETVYVARANTTDTYFVQVYHYGDDRSLRQDYTMTVRVFDNCTDDPLTTSGEQNDDQDSASTMPDPFERRQICSYDDDWYRFNHERTGPIRIDALFSHAQGDIDILLKDESGATVTGGSGGSVNDNEEVSIASLPAGDYYVRVRGHVGAQNSYKIFKSSGNLTTARDEDNADYAIEDGVNSSTPGVFTSEPLDFGAIPANSIVRSLTIKELDINHNCLNDLKVELLWDGEVIKTVWNRQGDACLDGQLDDDSLTSTACFGDIANRFFRTGNDICFQDRVYTEFGGLDARGDFQVRVSDYVSGDTGELVNLDIEIEYFLP